MTITDPTLHPPADGLVAHAAGQTDLCSRVLIETHAASCRRCRSELEDLRQPGGKLLETMPDLPLADSTWQGILDAVPRAEKSSPFEDTPIPDAARSMFEPDTSIVWQRLPASSAKIGRIRASGLGTSSVLVLATLPAGKSLPRHHHLGTEEVVVLTGGYQDDFGHFVAGDFATYSAGTTHRPDTDDSEDCWVLARIEGGVRLCGWRGWLQRLVTKISSSS